MEQFNEDLKQSIDLVQKAIIALDKKLQNQQQQISHLEQQFKNANFETKSNLEENPFFAEPISFSTEKAEEKLSSSENFLIFEEKVKNSETLEENIGGKWFARIGIAALTLGVSFFLKYAFDNNWIGQTGRIIIGLLIGLILLSIGEKTIRKYATYGQIITGGGIAVLYLSLFSAYNFYHLISSPTAFASMLVVTAAGIALSLRYDALSLMTVATIGGFATPFLASSGQNNQIGLLSYLVLLDIAILSLAIFKKWHSINMVGFMGTVLLFGAWAAEYYTRADLAVTLFFLTIFFLIFSIIALAYNLVNKEKSSGYEQLLTLITGISYFSANYALLSSNYHWILGFFTLLIGAYYFAWAFFVRNLTPEDENLYSFLAFLTVGFITLALPIQFNQNIVTIGWAIESVLLMIIGAKLKKNIYTIFSLVVAMLTVFRYLIVDVSSYNQFTVPVFNRIFLTALVLIAVSYLLAYVVKIFINEDDKMLDRKALIASFIIFANILTVFAISKEISASYDQNIALAQAGRDKELSAYSTGSQFYGSKYSNEQYVSVRKTIEKYENKKSISLSIFWVIYSIVLLLVGVVGRFKGARVGGIVLLSLAILKLFFIDLWNLGTLYRIISSMVLGTVLILISFGYNRFKDQLKELI